MALNRLQPGTLCTVRNTGESGIIKQIYFYPTKYEIEFPDGRILHLSSKDLEIDGVQQNPVLRKVADVPDDGIGESWSTWSPFEYESSVRLSSSSILVKSLIGFGSIIFFVLSLI